VAERNTKSKANDHEYFRTFFADVCPRRRFGSVILKELSPDIIFLRANSRRSGRASRFFQQIRPLEKRLREANNFPRGLSRLENSLLSFPSWARSWELSTLISKLLTALIMRIH